MNLSFGKKEDCPTCQALREAHSFAMGSLQQQHDTLIESLMTEHKIALGNMKEQHAQQIESLREQLAAERTEKNLLLHTMLEERKPKEVPVPVTPDEPTIIRKKTWDIKRAELEAQSREQAIRLANLKRNEEIASIEKAVGLDNPAEHIRAGVPHAAQ